MEIKPAGNIPYTEWQWNNYKKRLANTLKETAIDTDTAFADSTIKQYIVKYMESEILSEKSENRRLLQNINIRLVHMDIETAFGKKTYPIINEYKGHHLMRTYYFYKEEDGSCKMGYVDVVEKGIILL